MKVRMIAAGIVLLFAVLSCAPPESGAGKATAGGKTHEVLVAPRFQGPVMVRESLDHLAPDSSAVLHIRNEPDSISQVMQGLEIFHFTGRHPHAVAANIVAQVQPNAAADTIRGMKVTTQNVGAVRDLMMYGMDVRMRCSGPGSSGCTMVPLWVHAEDILGGARNLVSRPIVVTAPTHWEESFASHVAITAEGPVHVTRGPLRVYRDMAPSEADPDPIEEEAGPGDVVAEGRVFGKEGIAVPTLDDANAKAGVLFFSDEDGSLRFRAPDGTLYRLRLEKI